MKPLEIFFIVLGLTLVLLIFYLLLRKFLGISKIEEKLNELISQVQSLEMKNAKIIRELNKK